MPTRGRKRNKPVIAADSMLSKAQRSKLRCVGVSSNLRARGRKRYVLLPMSRGGLWKRQHRDRVLRKAVKCIIIGCGIGRCGSSCFAANLQRQKWDVSHEAGNPSSSDRRPGFRDRFAIVKKPKRVKDKLVSVMYLQLLKNPRNQPVVGDVSWANSVYAEAFLKMDQRVTVVFQTRPLNSWLRSYMKLHPTVTLWESVLLRSYGIDVERTPLREHRLIKWARRMYLLGRRLKAKYRGRVHIVPLGRLNTWGKKFLRTHGGIKIWDRHYGLNAASSCRDMLRVGKKRKTSTSFGVN